MKANIRTRHDKETEEIHATQFMVRMRDGIFGVIAPMHDDWARTEDYDLGSQDVYLETDEGEMILDRKSVV